MAWIWTFLWVKPWFHKSIRVTSKWSKLDALIFLLTPLFSIPCLCLSFEWAVKWIIYVDVSAWSWIRAFGFLIARTFITTVESGMNCLFHHDFVLDVVLLFFVIILTWTGILRESLSSVWGFSLMLPELTSLGLGEKRLWLLSNQMAIRISS